MRFHYDSSIPQHRQAVLKAFETLIAEMKECHRIAIEVYVSESNPAAQLHRNTLFAQVTGREKLLTQAEFQQEQHDAADAVAQTSTHWQQRLNEIVSLYELFTDDSAQIPLETVQQVGGMFQKLALHTLLQAPEAELHDDIRHGICLSSLLEAQIYAQAYNAVTFEGVALTAPYPLDDFSGDEEMS